MRLKSCLVFMVLVAAATVHAEEPLRLSPEKTGAPVQSIDDFPRAAEDQTRGQKLRLPEIGVNNYELCPLPEMCPEGGGTATKTCTWSLCKTNQACSVSLIGDCYSKVYAKCQSNQTKGNGCAACQGC